MKTILFTCLFLFISMLAFSQNSNNCPEITFLYDASGNRYQRAYNSLGGPCPSYPKVIKPDSTLTITTYPNPTTSLLNIDITSKDSTCSEPTLVTMYDINAQPVFLGSTSQNKLQLDVSSLAQGTYVVKVNTCNYQSSSVVLKVNNTSATGAQSTKHVVEIVKY